MFVYCICVCNMVTTKYRSAMMQSFVKRICTPYPGIACQQIKIMKQSINKLPEKSRVYMCARVFVYIIFLLVIVVCFIYLYARIASIWYVLSGFSLGKQCCVLPTLLNYVAVSVACNAIHHKAINNYCFSRSRTYYAPVHASMLINY